MKQFEIISQSSDLKGDIVIVNGEIFTFKNTGLTRRVFVNSDKTKVIKIHCEAYGVDWNKEEQEIWDNASEEKRQELAHTSTLPSGWVMQEFLHTLDDPDTENWLGRPLSMREIRFSQSCRNDVGFDENGNLKCFDLHEYKQY